MDVLKPYLDEIQNKEQQVKISEFLNWIYVNYPQLEPKIAWKQPMFTDHETFIIGVSFSKNHMAIAPEKAAMQMFSEEIKAAGFDTTANFIKVTWNQEIDLDLISKIIAFNIADKKDCTTFWRK